MKKVLNRQGFTLVELMVVVAIMGVLIAIAVPAYNNATAGAEKAVCDANRRTYDSAVMQYKMADTANKIMGKADITFLNAYMKDSQEVKCPTTGASYTFVATSENAWTITCATHSDSSSSSSSSTPTT